MKLVILSLQKTSNKITKNLKNKQSKIPFDKKPAIYQKMAFLSYFNSSARFKMLEICHSFWMLLLQLRQKIKYFFKVYGLASIAISIIIRLSLKTTYCKLFLNI